MRILVCGEGPNDIGREPKNEKAPRELGTLQVLISRILAQEEIEFEQQQILHLGPRRGSRGFKAKLELAFQEMSRKDCQALVYVVDADREQKRGDRLRAARDDVAEGRLCAMGTAIHSIEAWLLADQQAFSLAFDCPTPNMTPDPESIKNPKSLLRDRLEHVERDDYSRCYAKLARHLDLAVVRRRCPDGFQPFQSEVEGLLPR